MRLAPKAPNKDRAFALNERDVPIVESLGRRFRGFLDRQFYWRREALRFLKARSRVISLADLKAEGGFMMAAPHTVPGRRTHHHEPKSVVFGGVIWRMTTCSEAAVRLMDGNATFEEVATDASTGVRKQDTPAGQGRQPVVPFLRAMHVALRGVL